MSARLLALRLALAAYSFAAREAMAFGMRLAHASQRRADRARYALWIETARGRS